MKPRIHRLSRLTAVTLTAFTVATTSSHAGPIDWDGGGADDNLSTGANWVGNPSPVEVSSIFKFGGDTRNAPVNNYAIDTVLGTAGANLFWFTNDGSAGKTQAFTLKGNRIQFTGGQNIVTSAITTGPTITDTIDTDLVLTSGNLAVLPSLGHDLIISGDISETSARQFIKQGAGAVTLSGNNSFTGGVSIFSGTLNIDTLTDSGSSSSIGTNGTLLFNQSTTGVLNYTGGATVTDRKFVLGGQQGFDNLVGTIISNGSGALVFDNGNFNAVATVTALTSRTLDLGGANTAANEIKGIIQNNTPTGGGMGEIKVTKEDAGLWILSGNNTCC